MRKVCVVTGTRAEFGLLYWVMKGLQNDPELLLQTCVTGMHLSPEFGLTYKEIKAAGFQIDEKVEMLLSSDTATGVTKSMGLGMIGMAGAFARLKPNIVLLVGDRFEIFAAAAAAMMFKIPIAHCHGGEATEGAYDESIRHAITKMSHLHFTSTEKYRQRVVQMGERPDFVFNVGALGIENINKLKLLPRKDFEEKINFSLAQQSALVTFHPVTLEHNSAGDQFALLLSVLTDFPNLNIIFTKPNADTDGRIISKMIDSYIKENTQRACAFTSMGQLLYLSALQHVDLVIGNSSSGIIEVPSFKIPTVNIGDRQKGRVRSQSVIQCNPDFDSVHSAIQRALSREFRDYCITTKNPYGNGNASERILSVLKDIQLDNILKKQFYDL